MANKFDIFTHTAKPLTEINSATTPRSWVMNDVGRCEFSMSLMDAKTTEINLQYGNLVHIVHIPSVSTENSVVLDTNGKLPDWTGIILPPRVWNAGVLNATAYTAEAILTFRPMPYESVSGTPAVIFKKILELANQWPGVHILPGNIEDINKTFSDDLRNSAYEHIVTLIKRSGMSWSVTGEIGRFGDLELYGNLTVGTGTDTGMDMNDLNSELRSPIMTEQGTPYNTVIGYSFAHTKNGRYVSRPAISQGSFADYGFFGKNMNFMGLHDPSSVDWSAQQQANAMSRPSRIMSRTALDYRDTFDHLVKGNYVDVDEKGAGFAPGGGFGFTGKGRIISLDYSDLSNKANMNLELVYG